MLGLLLRLYSYLYHSVLALFLLGLAVLAWMSSNTLHLPVLPWSGESATGWLMASSLFGLLSIVLAVTGIFRFLFPLWAFFVLAIMVRGYLLQPTPFATDGEFRTAMMLLGGALIAFLASLTLFAIRRRV